MDPDPEEEEGAPRKKVKLSKEEKKALRKEMKQKRKQEEKAAGVRYISLLSLTSGSHRARCRNLQRRRRRREKKRGKRRRKRRKTWWMKLQRKTRKRRRRKRKRKGPRNRLRELSPGTFCSRFPHLHLRLLLRNVFYYTTMSIRYRGPVIARKSDLHVY